MAASNKKTQQKHIHSEGTYSSKELGNFTLDDGTRVVTSPTTDIRRPVCAGIDVHKEILMAAVCITDPATLSALFCHSSNYLEPFSSVYLDVLSGSDSVLVRLNGGYSA